MHSMVTDLLWLLLFSLMLLAPRGEGIPIRKWSLGSVGDSMFKNKRVSVRTSTRKLGILCPG